MPRARKLVETTSILLVAGCGNTNTAGPAPSPFVDAASIDAADADLDAASSQEHSDAPLLGLDERPHNATCVARADADMPMRLSETGCVDRTDPREPAPGLIPYAVIAPLWSDGAEKERYLALPDGARISIGPDGDLDLPAGTVLVKVFRLAGSTIETRLFMRRAPGEWAGYTYAWNEARTDATLVEPDGVYQTIGNQEWHYPSRQHCLDCHTQAAGFSLGLELAQLDRALTYPNGRTANQLVTWRAIGLFEDGAAIEPATSLSAPTDATAPLAGRARSYLHANCGNCHRPSGVREPNVVIDLRFSTSLGETKICDEPPHRSDLGILDARILAPGDPARSLISIRMHTTVPSIRMPPLASALVDEHGTDLIDGFIRALSSCF
jgi:uncharacterized repeat protein (TIGR03806 family)